MQLNGNPRLYVRSLPTRLDRYELKCQLNNYEYKENNNRYKKENLSDSSSKKQT